MLHWLDRKVRLMNFEPAVATGLKRIKMEEDKTLLSYIIMAEAYLNNQPVQTAPTPGFLTYMRVAVVLTGRRDCMERWVHSEVRVAMQQLGIVDYRHYDTNDLCADNLELVDKIKRRVVSWPPKLEIDAEGRAHLPPEAVTIWCSTLGFCRRVGSRFMFESRHLPYAWLSALETGLFAEQRVLETVVPSASVIHPLMMQKLLPPKPFRQAPRGIRSLKEITASPNLVQCQRRLIETYDRAGEFKQRNHDTRFAMVTFLVHAGMYTDELEDWLSVNYKKTTTAMSVPKSFASEITNSQKFHPRSCATLQKDGLCPFNDMVKCKQAIPSSPVELNQWGPLRVFQTPPPPLHHDPKVEVQIAGD